MPAHEPARNSVPSVSAAFSAGAALPAIPLSASPTQDSHATRSSRIPKRQRGRCIAFWKAARSAAQSDSPDLNRNTIMRLLSCAGRVRRRLMDAKIRRLRSRYLQLDEIWTFVGKKHRNLRRGDAPDFGSQWVYVAIDAETKLIASYSLGQRLQRDTRRFLADLYYRIEGDTQITTDGLHHYRESVPECFGPEVISRRSPKCLETTGNSTRPMRGTPHHASRGLYPRSDKAIPIPNISARLL